MNYFYDKQIRQHLVQFIRMFSNFSVQIGESENGDPIYRTVPAKYGDPTRMAAAIMRENSENKMLSVPQITVYITNINMAPDRRHHIGMEAKQTIYEKEFNQATGDYTTDAGNSYQITKATPVPYDVDYAVDIWTSNTDQKLQLLEQLLVIFNPTIDLRSNKNPFDWTAFTYNELVNIQYSSRSQPVGTEDIIDIATLSFRTMMYLTPPAKFNRSKLIYTIINKLYTMDSDQVDLFRQNKSFSHDSLSYVVVTPSQYWMEVNASANTISIQNQDATTVDSNAETLSWRKILASIGNINDGFSQIRLRLAGTPDDDDSDVVATISYNSGNVNLLDFTLDSATLPSTTLTAVDKIVNPIAVAPGSGLPAAASGQRYIITDEVPIGGNWGMPISGNPGKGDIIAYDGANWSISFDASANGSTAQYITNNDNSDLLYFNGEDWVHAWRQRYKPGFWRVFL